MTEGPINTIMLIRLNILPPYSYDDDEGGRDKDEYLKFYKNKIEDCLKSIDEYIEALDNFSVHSQSDDALSKLLAARVKFIEYFPFAYDELKDEELPYQDGFLTQIKNIYKEDLKSDFLIKKLREYRAAVSEFKNI